MKVWRTTAEFAADPVRRPYVTVGFFDGVHKGHRSMLAELREMAEIGGGSTVVITFRPLGSSARWQSSALNYTDERLKKLEETGLDGVLLFDFTGRLRNLDPRRFIKEYILDGLKAAGVCVGYDHRFGRGGAGDFSLVAASGKEYGFEVRAAAPYAKDGRVISSTLIRNKIRERDVEAAARLLGYVYEVEGEVVPGRGLGGRELGYPTANLELTPKLLPGDGVYACFAYVVERLNDDQAVTGDTIKPDLPPEPPRAPYGAFINVGKRPTVDKTGRRTVEVHIFGFSGDLVGRRLRVRFEGYIREERKFPSLAELRRQLVSDEAAARRILSGQTT